MPEPVTPPKTNAAIGAAMKAATIPVTTPATTTNAAARSRSAHEEHEQPDDGARDRDEREPAEHEEERLVALG